MYENTNPHYFDHFEIHSYYFHDEYIKEDYKILEGKKQLIQSEKVPHLKSLLFNTII